jgi:hypothetical protein
MQIESTIHPIPTLAMPPCNTRRRRAPNREPTSLAASTTVLGSIEAVDIDPALTNPPFSRHSTPPPAPLIAPPISNEYPAFDTEFDVGYIYPSTIPPPQEREVTWSPTPPPLPLALALALALAPLPPPTPANNIQLSIAFKWNLEIEELLFYTLVEQVNIGKWADSRFKKEAWIACCTTLTNATIQSITVDRCKGKVDAMKAL